MTAGQMKNMMKIATYGKPFYASDLGMNGGEISALTIHCFIVPTGKTRKTMVQIDTWRGDRIFKESTIKEWEFNPRHAGEWREVWGYEIGKAIKDAQDILAAARAMGIEGV